LIDAEHARVVNQNGKIRSIQLVVVAATSAQRLGEPTPLSPASYGVRFVRRVQTEAGTYYEHHPRGLEPPY
jgi:hypothetical protein